MNKIFRVIWNNAKHCYVVASELAKSYTKGGGSRSIRRACAALCIATAVYAAAGSALAENSGGHLDGTDYIGDSPYNVTIDSNVDGNVYGRKEISETSEKAIVNISGGTVESYVYGGYSDSGNATSNSVNISGGTINGFLYGGFANSGLGLDSGGDATNNSVNIIAGNLGIIVYGGYSYFGNAASNSITIDGNITSDNCDVYAGYVQTGSGDATSNSINISGGTIGYVYGGYLSSSSGDAASNSVTISNETVTHTVYGGRSDTGTATKNNVNIIDSIIGCDDVYSGNIYAGFSFYGNVVSNSVNINGGTVKGYVYGGYVKESKGSIVSNLVNISGGTVNSVCGGYSDSGDIASNSVNISGGKFDFGSKIYAGYCEKPNNSTIKDNSVNLSNTIKSLGNTEIYGYFFEKDSGIHSGNELHIGRALDYDDEGNIKCDADGNIAYKSDETTIWQGKTSDETHNNKIKQISNFETLALHSVAWDTTLPALEAATISNVDSLDITDLKFYSKVNDKWEAKTLESGDSMALIKSESDLNLKLIYMENGTKKSVEAANFNKVNFQDSFTEANTSNGVKVSGTASKTVSLIDNKKTIQFYNEILFNKISFNNNQPLSFSNASINRDLEGKYDFIDNSTVDATDLIFADSSTLLKPSDSMTLVDNATGISAETSVTNGKDKTISINYTDSASGIEFGAKATGDVTAETNSVKFTIESVAGESVNLAKWNGTTAAFPDVWKANVNGVSVAGTFTDPGLSAGESKYILTASNAIFNDEKIDESIRFTESLLDNSLENGVSQSCYQTGGVKATDEGKALTYFAMEKMINKFNLANWDGENAVSVPVNWIINDGASIETDAMSSLPESDSEKEVFILKSDEEGFFANVSINGENIYGKKQNKFTDSDEAERVVLKGTQEQGVTLDSDKKNLVYRLSSKDVTSLKLNTIAWEQGAELLNRDKYNYSKLISIDTNDFKVVFEKPETVAANQSMTLLKANETLADMAAKDNSVSYQHEPVSGVTLDAVIRSSLEAKGGKVTLKTLSNKADKLTFGDVEWLDKGALIDHKTMLTNVSFDGAAVDTSKIAFTNRQKLDANSQMILVSDFDGNPGTITGTEYKVGTAYEGEGSAYIDGNDLVFKTKTGAGLSDETHATLMAMEAGVALVAAGSEHVGNAIEGLRASANAGADGVSTYASVGGASSRYKTGSHVDTNSWNCTLAVGKNLEKKDGTMEYGLFAEYGRGNYTLHMGGVEDAGSGNAHYTGGGLLLKWTNKHDVYTEASFRMGNMKDKASSLLHDGAGNAYGYDTSAKYRGGHFGIGKICREEDGTKLEIFGKYFYNEREGINFAAGADQYKLDEVRSRVLRAGFRLSSTDKKWNHYGGVAYDHEFGGKANGTVNGTPVRAASIKGGTLRGEFGYCREATKTNPWKTDISLYGFTGKRNGFGGSVAVEYHF